MQTRQQAEIHGHRVSYLAAGEGPPVILIHGVTGTCDQWAPVLPLLSARCSVVAPDLLGHGQSAKPRGDYSLGAYASGVRDLVVGLGHERVTVVGHSLGGGIAMQFAYQFPERCERLVLVASGGLGQEVHPVLRAATLPGSELVLPLIAGNRVHAAGTAVAGLLDKVGLRAGPDIAEMVRGYGSLADTDTRRAFVHTLRSVVDPMGQRVNATDRLYLAAGMPALIVWGRRDRVIPVSHAGVAERGMPGSRLEIFERSGHFPQLDDPVRFASVLTDFIKTTEGAALEADTLRERLLAGSARNGAPAAP
ncbi:MAG: alpha/beta fold hydrolase [Actinomycetota bacterium]|jgi:pimeloyl-ACP methyl ester carboxylesterase|nr:alpha/beta fold hydrolase [Thermoleophilaceae bacterium]MDQ3435649.1 alpha/beta fold hydrolase [Actinomycetota bacterium]